MGTINQIKSKLLELEGGVFQRLCDDWLFKQGYENINSIGMMQTTDRVAKGTPDCLFIETDGMYVFTEYTVQQTRLASKIEDDINKCFDEKKTGISNDQVREIIVCYLGKLSTHEISHLKAICELKSVMLSLNGLDTISLSIKNRYPILSEQYLGLPLDTGQLLAIDDFIKRYNQNEFTTTIDNRILFQEDALTQGLKVLEHNNFLLVSGPAGVGKTLYSVNLSKLVENKNSNVKVYCVFDKGADLTRDIIAHFSEPGEYLIFIDDANRLDRRLEYLLHYLNEQDEARTFKIIATVRDYARESVVETASKFTSINEQIISPLTDDQIKELIEKLFNIKNNEYQQRIQEIAGGNARLAIMASKVAVKTQQIQSIQNIASLYDDYFGQSENIKEIIDNINLIKTVCIISFLRRVDKLNETHMSWVQDIFGIQPEEFWEYVIILHSKEIVDMYGNEVVKISDQVLSTYLFYLAVFDKKHITFSVLVSNFYPDLKKTIVDALNPVINAFDHKKIIEVIRQDVLPLFENICTNKNDTRTLDFLNSFWFAMPTESLAFTKKYIDRTPNTLIDWESADFAESNNNSPESPLIKLLSNFKNYGKDELSMSLDMMLLYLEKSKGSLSDVIISLSDGFCFKPNDWRHGYAIQKSVIEKLMAKMEGENSYLFTRLFILVVKKYLQVEYREHQWTRGNAINIITFRLTPDEHLTPIRKSIFIGLSGLLKIKIYKRLVMELLHDYVSRLRFNGKEMAESDFYFIKKFIVKNLNNNDLSDCILVLELCEQLESLKISYPVSWKKTYTNEIIQLSDVLLEDRHEKRMLEMGYEEYNQYRQESLTKYFKNFTIVDFKKFMGSCQLLFQSLSGRDRDYSLKNGLSLSLTTLADTHKDNFPEIVSIYIDYDDVFGLNPNHIVLSLFDTTEPDNVWMLLNSKEFKWKKSWISSCFSHLPKKYITADTVNLLLDHLKTTPSNELPNWIDFLSNYLAVDESIFARAARILVNKSLEEQNFARPLEHIYSSHSEIFGKWFEVFESDKSLIFDAYVASYKISNHFDYSGEALKLLTMQDKELLFKFIDCVYEHDRWPSSYTNIPSLSFLWERDSYLVDIEKYALYIHEKEEFSSHRRDTIFKKLFSEDKSAEEKSELISKKREFVKYTIENNINNENYLCFIFNISNLLGNDFRREVLKFFIERNKSFSVFEKIEFEPSSRSWSGSLVPILEKEKDYLLSISPLFNTIDLLEHKAYIEKQIDYKIQHIEHEKKKDFMESRH